MGRQAVDALRGHGLPQGGLSLMGPSRYPRPGHPIAPATLRELLAVPAPADLFDGKQRASLLCELDATAWLRYPQEVCHELAEAVVKRVARRWSYMPEAVRLRPLPRPRRGLTRDDLQLSARTSNCLQRAGLWDRLTLSRNLRVVDVLQLRSFGARSLVDLLTSLEAAAPRPAPPSDRARVYRPALRREADRLRRLPGAEAIGRDDPRLGHLFDILGVPGKTLRDMADRLRLRTYDLPGPRAVEGLREVRRRIAACLRQPLEDELRDLLAGGRGGTRAEIVARALGWDGGGQTTFQAAAAHYGITREWVRQMAHRPLRVFQGKKPFAPALDRALAFVAARVPAPAAGLEARLAAAGLAARPFRLEGLCTAAMCLGRAVPCTIQAFGGERFALAPGAPSPAGVVLQLARKTVERRGVATLKAVAAQAARVAGRRIRVPLVRAVLQRQPDFALLDTAGGWFWFSSATRNPLRRLIREVLSVADRIGVAELCGAITREPRMKVFHPPQRVVMALCRQIPGISVARSTVHTDRSLDWRKTLPPTKRTLVAIFKARGPILSGVRLRQAALEAGLNLGTLGRYLSGSALIAKYGPALFGPVGAQVPRAFWRTFLRGRPRGGILVDYGWTADRHLWLAYRASAFMRAKGRFYPPFETRRFFRGHFALKSPKGSRIGTLVWVKRLFKGLQPAFMDRGGGRGEYLRLVFDLRARQAVASVGGAHLVEGLRRTSRWSLH
jgi:hypothetical protein